MKQAFKYRPDVDGLRAISILAVLFFHAGFKLFSGGFVGVDIFFVISGYLITQLLLAESEAGTYSFVEFYKRRIRRLMPASLAVIALTLLAASALMLPLDLRNFSLSALSATFFSANIYFWRVIDYFNPASGDKPLLHMWSLGVEEQFYLFWPLLMAFGLRRLGRRGFSLLIPVMLALSLLGAEMILKSRPNWAFFLPVFRAWELLVGACLAFGLVPQPRPGALGRLISEVLAICGIAGIGASIVLFDKSTTVPGIAGLLPCISAGLVIYSGASTETLVVRVLKCRPMVFIGLISYSLYLWHWPILSIPTYVLARNLTTVQAVVLLVLSFFAAVLSWKYIEVPFRSPSGKLGGREFKFFASTASAIALASIGLIASRGLAVRFPDEILEGELQANTAPFMRQDCDVGEDRLPPVGKCIAGAAAADREKYSAVLWGDSQADSYAPFLDELGKADGFRFRQISKNACLPAIDIKRMDPDYNSAYCEKFNNAALEEIAGNNNVTDVYLAGAWGGYFVVWYMARPSSPSVSREATIEAVKGALILTVDRLVAMHKRVHILEAVPLFGYPSKCVLLAEAFTWHRLDCSVPFEAYQAREKLPDQVFASLVQTDNVDFVQVHDLFCDKTSCSPVLGGRPVYYDSSHLSDPGSRSLAALYLRRRNGDRNEAVVQAGSGIEGGAQAGPSH